MSTSDTPVVRQGRKPRHATRTPSTTDSHNASILQAHSSNSQFTMTCDSSQPTTPPRTPRRLEDPSVFPAETNGYTSNDAPAVAYNSSAKPKSRTKNRPKNVVTSPSASNISRATPPLTGAQSAGLPKPGKTPSSIAYAGPTFHASPAPSALPLPSFYSKSVPESPAPIGIKSLKDDTSSNSSDSPTPPAAELKEIQRQREESPLDFFFNAHRAEKARAHGSSSGASPFQPPFESPPVNHTPIVPTRAHSAHFSSGNASSKFAMDLENTNSPGKPVGASFATPYHERIKAARSSSSQSQPLMNSSPGAPPPGSSSQALRDYLFSGAPLPSHQAPTKEAPLPSFVRSTSGPSTPVGGFQTAHHPNRSYHTDFPFGNESIQHKSPRTSSRSSGLRQEVSQTKTPAKKFDISERVTSAPPKMSTNPSYVNNASNQHIISGVSQSSAPSALPTRHASDRSRSNDLLDLEERLRGALKLGPAQRNASSGFPYAPPDSVSGYRAASMKGGFNGVGGP